MKYCTKCGRELQDSAKFCITCGERQESTVINGQNLSDEVVSERENIMLLNDQDAAEVSKMIKVRIIKKYSGPYTIINVAIPIISVLAAGFLKLNIRSLSILSLVAPYIIHMFIHVSLSKKDCSLKVMVNYYMMYLCYFFILGYAVCSVAIFAVIIAETKSILNSLIFVLPFLIVYSMVFFIDHLIFKSEYKKALRKQTSSDQIMITK